MNPLAASILFHAIGAASAAFCYLPQRKVRGWSWQSYWLAQAAFCWLLLPIAGAFLTVPAFLDVVNAAPASAMIRTFLLGAAYGIGGTAFGLAIRYVGFSITYAMAIGISTVVGTAYAIAKGDTNVTDAGMHVQQFLAKSGSSWVVAGIGVGVLGIVCCGVAGRWKERDQAVSQDLMPANRNAVLGLFLCIVAGMLSAVYGMALTEGAPISKIAERFSEGHTVMGIDAATFGSNAIYPFANSGAFLTTALYCLYLHRRQGTFREMASAPQPEAGASLKMNWGLAVLTGCLWYGQFFFYGFGHFYIMKVAGFEQTCWAIHMILLILLGTMTGVALKEWKGAHPRTYLALALSVALLIAGKLMLDYGNYVGQAK